MTEGTEPKKTPLYPKHILAHAKIVEFAGFLMPMFYEGIVPEHKAVRQNVGVFDVSHMGEFYISGPGALEFIQKMTTNDASRLSEWQAQYSTMLYDHGGIVDDLLVYRLPDRYLLVVNAANIDKDFEWLKSHLPESGVELHNASDEVAQIAIQGPRAQDVLQKLVNYDLEQIKYYHAAELDVAGERMLVSRTGYTGEDGFELYMKPEVAGKIWDALLEAGEPFGIKPCGLGARDTLRLEMKYALYGNDIDETTNPYEAGLGWIVKLEKGDFIGREAIIDAKAKGLKRKLVCLELQERGFPRHGYKVFREGKEVGVVTSGTFSPMLNKGIALAYVPREFSKPGNTFEVQVRNVKIPAVVVKPPFWKNGTVRVKHT
ncbi:MAG TPA: glycine cleavage system aminomethyltransferase GcvT [candidate division Zixibacteria bacterium]|nr:glycine cleavage system aminomethyltransferase GcvT [candidate division Zixibacteria bacterium]